MSNHAIRVKVEHHTGSQITTQSRHYSPEMHREADTARIKPMVKQSTFDLKHACNAAKITDAIQLVSRADKQRQDYKAYRAAKKARN